jgi:hypothetical protein
MNSTIDQRAIRLRYLNKVERHVAGVRDAPLSIAAETEAVRDSRGVA